MKKNNIVIIGAGIMGAGIAQVIAQHGMPVHIIDKNTSSIKSAKNQIRKSLNILLRKKLISSQDIEIIINEQITWNSDIKETLQEKNINLIIEAVPENEKIKCDIINIVNSVCENKNLIYTSNTSSISITKMAQRFYAPHNFIGMHFMNPVPIMKLVEVIPGLQTAESTIEFVNNFVQTIGKTVTKSIDRPGFIANRILIPMINEGFYALMEKIGTPEDIDKTMCLGCNHPIGPLALADLIGLDTCLHIANILHRELGDDKYRACPLLKQYVSAGWLGRKSKRGVFTY